MSQVQLRLSALGRSAGMHLGLWYCCRERCWRILMLPTPCRWVRQRHVDVCRPFRAYSKSATNEVIHVACALVLVFEREPTGAQKQGKRARDQGRVVNKSRNQNKHNYNNEKIELLNGTGVRRLQLLHNVRSFDVCALLSEETTRSASDSAVRRLPRPPAPSIVSSRSGCTTSTVLPVHGTHGPHRLNRKTRRGAMALPYIHKFLRKCSVGH